MTPNDPRDDLARSALRSHLDDAVPSADERRADLARLERARRRKPRARFLIAVVPALLVGGIVGGVARGATSPAFAAAAASGDGYLFLGPYGDPPTRTNAPPSVEVVGTLNVYRQLMMRSVGRDRPLPAGVADRLVHWAGGGLTTRFDLYRDLADAQHLDVRVDPRCVDKHKLIYMFRSVPLPLVLDELAAASSAHDTFADGALIVRCDGLPDGPLDDVAHPVEDPRLDTIVSLTVEDMPADQVLEKAAALVGAHARFGGLVANQKAMPRFTFALHDVRFRTLLHVLEDHMFFPNLDGDTLVSSGPHMESPAEAELTRQMLLRLDALGAEADRAASRE